MKAKTPGISFPLRFKLGLLTALLATIPVAVTGYVAMEINTDAVLILSREAQLAVVDDVARTLDQSFVEGQDGLDAVGRVLTNPELPEDAVVPIALSTMEAHESLEIVGVYDRQGALIDAIREEGSPRLELPERLPRTLLELVKSRNMATGPAEIQLGAPRVPLVIPLKAGGQATGFVASLHSLEPVQRRVERISQLRFDGLSNAVFVVDQRLKIVAHTNPARARALESAANEAILADLDAEALMADLTRSGEFIAADGTLMVGSRGSLPGRPWVVVAQVPAVVAYHTLIAMRTWVLITVFVTMVIALFVGFLGARRVTSPLAALTTFAEHLAARRFHERVAVETHDELNILARALTRAAEDLQASEHKLAEEAAIRADLGRYLPERLVDKVVRREQDMNLGGVRRDVTVLFADVVEFTPLTEKLRPEDVVTILNELFTILTGIVFRYGGMVDKFVGDCVMALWGAPTPIVDHATKALSAAEDMLQWLEMGNATWQERFGVTVRLAIGVHTGEVVVGNIGSKSRMEYTAIGHVVNVASRLENIARPQQILITQATRQAAGEGFEYADAGVHDMPGTSVKLQLYEVRL